jgi:hypothetical protein
MTEKTCMDRRIARFIKKHHVLTLATSNGNVTWTSHVFYAWLPEETVLVFTTDPDTRHGKEMMSQPVVSGGIVLETKVIGRIRGVQLTGRAESVGNDPGIYRSAYIKRFPFALAAKLDLWVLRIEQVKMTDNRLGFGKKLIWNREG